jgi:hypothetical protein
MKLSKIISNKNQNTEIKYVRGGQPTSLPVIKVTFNSLALVFK